MLATIYTLRTQNTQTLEYDEYDYIDLTGEVSTLYNQVLSNNFKKSLFTKQNKDTNRRM